MSGSDSRGPDSPASNASNPPFTADVADRIFPIRSVVSVDPVPAPLARQETSGGFSGDNDLNRSSLERSKASLQMSEAPDAMHVPSKQQSTNPDISTRGLGRPRNERKISTPLYRGLPNRIFGDSWSTKSESTESSGENKLLINGQAGSVESEEAKDSDVGAVTARFKHITTAEGHAVITGRDGDTLQRCEDEPIHIPGAVQGFGLLIALCEEVEGKLSVKVVSENSKRIIGYSPRALFAIDNFLDILSEDQADNLLDHLDFIKDDDADPATSGPEVFTLSIRPPQKRTLKLWCAIHINPKNPDLIICEFELDDDPVNPLVSPEVVEPEDILQLAPTDEEFAASTVIASRPLRILRSARKRRGEAAAMEVFNIMSQVQEQLANAPNLNQFLKVLVGVVKELTGFHRAMIYQFDSAWNGRVVAELVDPRATKDLYKGLNFPASDIPKQARDLYKINKVRLLYDRDQEAARLVCRTVEDLETPLDLSLSYLRAMSPIHIKYLTNMGVRSSMSVSITAFNELWGLVACHGYGTKGMRVSFPIRKMCRLIGDSASRNIERLSYASRLQARKLINTMPSERNPSGYIVASSDDLLALFDADFGLLSIRDETKILGSLDQSHEALALLEYLRVRSLTSVTASCDIRGDFPDLRYDPGFQVIAGLLLVPLSVDGEDFIVFFRKSQVREVTWAGNPYEKFVKEGTNGSLEPRNSFKTWRETVVGKCRDWNEEQVETAGVLCLVYGKFIDVWRQKEAALQKSQLTRLLLANSAHEVRTPLNAIINYLEIALEGSLDPETRENLSRSHSASKSLIYVINDLLDLTKTEEGRNLIKNEIFDLPATVKEATDMFVGDAKRKGIDFQVIENSEFPRMVVGDQRRVRQAISNITANAVQNTTAGSVVVELWIANEYDDRVDVEIIVQDTGAGMSVKKLESLFRALEQVSTEGDEVFKDSFADSKSLNPDNEGTAPLGLGLAVVSRVVRNMNGQLRLKSEEGKGSRFVIQLPFMLPPHHDRPESRVPSQTIGGSSLGPTTPPPTEGEVMLINNVQASGLKTPPTSGKEHVNTRKRSIDSIQSLMSMKSGSSARSGMSDVDRLIGAIQEPQMVSRPSSERGNRLAERRSKSKGSDARPGDSSQRSSVVPERFQITREDTPGEQVIADSKMPLKAVRVPGDTVDVTRPLSPPSRVSFNMDSKAARQSAAPPTADNLQILVAEDDPINSKIMKKRLEKLGHEVTLTVNGEECATLYSEKVALFDVVLMDMQVSHGLTIA